jgi:hypothetical protein
MDELQNRQLILEVKSNASYSLFVAVNTNNKVEGCISPIDNFVLSVFNERALIKAKTC